MSEHTALRRKNSLLVEATLWPDSAQGWLYLLVVSADQSPHGLTLGLPDPMHTCSSARLQGEVWRDLNHPQPPPCLVAWPPGALPCPLWGRQLKERISRMDGSSEPEPDRLSEWQEKGGGRSLAC